MTSCSFSERDLIVFLGYIREIGLGSGRLPEKEYDESTYHVNIDDEWIRVQSLSLNDEGVKAAIEQSKQINQGLYHLAFNYNMIVLYSSSLYNVSLRKRYTMCVYLPTFCRWLD